MKKGKKNKAFFYYLLFESNNLMKFDLFKSGLTCENWPLWLCSF